jgi:hypothetical protein
MPSSSIRRAALKTGHKGNCSGPAVSTNAIIEWVCEWVGVHAFVRATRHMLHGTPGPTHAGACPVHWEWPDMSHP